MNTPTPTPTQPAAQAAHTPRKDPTLGHTPLPWTYISRRTLHHVESSIDAKVCGEPVCSIPLKREADAALITRNVNGYAWACEQRDSAQIALRTLLDVPEVKEAAFNFAVTEYNRACIAIDGKPAVNALARLTEQNAALVDACRNALYLADIYRKKVGDGLMVGAFQDIAMRTRAALAQTRATEEATR